MNKHTIDLFYISWRLKCLVFTWPGIKNKLIGTHWICAQILAAHHMTCECRHKGRVAKKHCRLGKWMREQLTEKSVTTKNCCFLLKTKQKTCDATRSSGSSPYMWLRWRVQHYGACENSGGLLSVCSVVEQRCFKMEKYKHQNATKPLPLYPQKSFCLFQPVDTLKTSPAVTYRNQNEILPGSVEALGFFI